LNLIKNKNKKVKKENLDGSVCNDGSTCCQLSSGQYACCPHRMFSFFFSFLLNTYLIN